MGGDVGGDRRDLGVQARQARTQRGAGARVVVLLRPRRGQRGVQGGLGPRQVVQGGQGIPARPRPGGGATGGDGGLGVGHEGAQGGVGHPGGQAPRVDQVGGDGGDGGGQVGGGAVQALAGAADLGGDLTGLGDGALGDAHLLDGGGLLPLLGAGARLVEGGAPRGQQLARALGGLGDGGQGARRVGGVQRDEQRVGHGDGLLGLVGALGGLGDGGRQVRLQTAAGVEGLLLPPQDDHGLGTALEDLPAHLALLGLSLRDVVVEQLAQLEGAREVAAGDPQGLGEGVRGGQPELGLGVGQLLGGRPHGVVGPHQGGARPGVQIRGGPRRGCDGCVALAVPEHVGLLGRAGWRAHRPPPGARQATHFAAGTAPRAHPGPLRGRAGAHLRRPAPPPPARAAP